MSRQSQWNNVWLTERWQRGRREEGYHGRKSDSNGRSATPTTAIPNSGRLAGDCGFAYPLLVYWNRSFLFPFLPFRKSYHRIVPSFPFILSRTPFVVLSSIQSSRPSEAASLPSATLSPLTLFHLVLVSHFLSLSLRFSPLRYPPRRPSATYTKPTGPRLLLRDTR